jgi:hypothetical protein
MSKKLIMSALLISFCGCSKKLPNNFDPVGKILYIEDLDGGEGLMAGTFGDIVALDPETNQKYRITSDRYYDANASWFPSGKRIIFESRRTDCKYCDVSTPCHLFTVEIPSLRITQFDKNFHDKFSIISEDENECPVVNHQGGEVAFFTREHHPSINPYFSLVVYNLVKDTVELIEDSLKSPHNLHWSNDDKYLTYTEDFFLQLLAKEHAVSVVDKTTKKRILYIGKESWYYVTAGFHGSKLIYSGYELKEFSPVTIFECSLTNTESKQLFSFQDCYPSDLVFIDSTRIYANVTQNDKCDIGIIDLHTGKLEKLTNDGHDKQGLSYLDKILSKY